MEKNIKKDIEPLAFLKIYKYISKNLAITLPLVFTASLIITILSINSNTITPLVIGGLITLISHAPIPIKIRSRIMEEDLKDKILYYLAPLVTPLFIYLIPISEYIYYSRSVVIDLTISEAIKILEPAIGIPTLIISAITLYNLKKHFKPPYDRGGKLSIILVIVISILIIISIAILTARFYNVYTPLTPYLIGIYISYIILNKRISVK